MQNNSQTMATYAHLSKNTSLESLRRKWSSCSDDSIRTYSDSFIRYLRIKGDTIVDAAAIATNIGVNVFHADHEVDPKLLQSIRMTNPALDKERLLSLNDEQISGIVNSAKGKYFELIVEEKLNNGERVGDIVLPNGYTAKLADSMTQPAWDLQILDDNGHVSDYLQLKATDSLGYIKDTLERYPDIKILATDEVADHLHGGNYMVFDSDIANDAITEHVYDVVHDEAAGFSEKFLDSFSPLIPLAVIAATEGMMVLLGKKTVEEALERSSYRVPRSIVAGGVGAFVYAVGGGLLSVPASMVTRLLIDREKNLNLLSQSILSHKNKLLMLKDHTKSK